MRRKKRKYTKRKISSPKGDSTIETTVLSSVDKPVCPICNGKGYIDYEHGLIRIGCQCRS